MWKLGEGGCLVLTFVPVFNVLIKLSDTLTNASALMNHLDSDIILIISLF